MDMLDRIDALVRESESFKKIMADGVVEDSEVNEQGRRVEMLLSELENSLSDEQFRHVTEFMAELSVLQVVMRYNQNGGL